MGAEVAVHVGALGQPAAAALPASLSPTRAEEFRQCELKFFFAGVERWRTPPTEHTALGNVVHDVAEQLYQLAPRQRDRAAAGELLEQVWPAWASKHDHAQLLSADSGAAIKARANAALDGLFELEDPSLVQIAPDQIEAWVDASLGEHAADPRARSQLLQTGGDGVGGVHRCRR